MAGGEAIQIRDMVDEEKKETEDILEIIEECSVTQDDESGGEEQTEKNDDSYSDLNDSTTSHSKSTHEFEFSLSSITFALGDVLQGSAAKLGDAITAGGKLRHHHHHHHAPNSYNNHHKPDAPLGGSSHHSLSVMRAKLRSSNHSKKPRVDFGHFEERAVRLQYTADDVFEIVNDPLQFEQLRNALRTMGAVTDTLIKQKLHWYVKNSKRERERQAQSLQEQQQEATRLRRIQEAAEPVTPPTEPKLIDSGKVLKDGANVIISDLDPSPKSVRGIFVPSSAS
jgi:hypothetical protein